MLATQTNLLSAATQQNGFSIVEVIVSLAILGLVSVHALDTVQTLSRIGYHANHCQQFNCDSNECSCLANNNHKLLLLN